MSDSRETAKMAGNASPRNPSVPMASRSASVRSFDVACRSSASKQSSGVIPRPSSVTATSCRPAPRTATSMRVAPASRLFSTSSLTMDAGRSITSPAAILLTTASGKRRTAGFAVTTRSQAAGAARGAR